VQTLNEEFLLPGDRDEALRRFAEAASGLRGVTVRSSAPGQLLIDDEWHPFWTIVVAIVFFPIGLLVLLIKQKKTIVVNAADGGGDGAAVSLHGEGREGLCRLLRGVVTTTD
jgi:hypothetical protein